MAAIFWVKVRATLSLSSLVLFSWQQNLSDCSRLAPIGLFIFFSLNGGSSSRTLCLKVPTFFTAAVLFLCKLKLSKEGFQLFSFTFGLLLGRGSFRYSSNLCGKEALENLIYEFSIRETKVFEPGETLPCTYLTALLAAHHSCCATLN